MNFYIFFRPMTQYQGAVTIYQYMDATVDNANIHRREPLDCKLIDL